MYTVIYFLINYYLTTTKYSIEKDSLMSDLGSKLPSLIATLVTAKFINFQDIDLITSNSILQASGPECIEVIECDMQIV